MISQDTINKINDTCLILEVVQDYVQLKKNGANYVGLSPFSNEKTPSFTVSVSKNIFKCFSSGKGGDCITFLMEYKKLNYPEAIKVLCDKYQIEYLEDGKAEIKPFKRPIWKNNTILSDNVIKWFESRKISQKTLLDFKIGEGVEWMPQKGQEKGKEINTIQFNYFVDNQLINTKYRDGAKNFKMVKDAELVCYNLDAIVNEDIVIYVEGEIDALSFHEAGIKNVISVPNGATKGKNNLTYLDNSIHLLEGKKEHWLALDDDENGRNLRDELARRFGFEKCYKITFNGCKDANECLVKEGINGLIKAVSERKEYPIVGVFTARDIDAEINDYYHNGLPKGDDIGLPSFDRLLKFHLGYITTITGVPGMGKSEYLDFLSAKLNILHGWKFGLYSPENYPLELHFSKYAEKITGKPFSGSNRMNELELKKVKEHFDNNFFFIKPENDFTLDNILASVKQLITRKGINAFVIDAWNKIEHNYDNSETQYISKQLDKLSIFCETNKVHLFLVAHPAKVQKDKSTGFFEVPNLYSISGSANFYNKTSNGITVHIDPKNMQSNIYIQKVKFKHWGERGMVVLNWDRTNGRYYEDVPDYSSWLSKEEQSKINIPTPFRPNVSFENERPLVNWYEPEDSQPPF